MAFRVVRVVGGQARGRALKAPKGGGLRPTSQRVRIAIFDTLARDIDGASVLDLYAGTGALGIECLSRGARRAVFVERNEIASRSIAQNVQQLGFESRAKVVLSSVEDFLTSSPSERFDLVLVDPPYEAGLTSEVLRHLPLFVAKEGTVVVETSKRSISVDPGPAMTLADRRVYGDTAVLYMKCTGP